MEQHRDADFDYGRIVAMGLLRGAQGATVCALGTLACACLFPVALPEALRRTVQVGAVAAAMGMAAEAVRQQGRQAKLETDDRFRRTFDGMDA